MQSFPTALKGRIFFTTFVQIASGISTRSPSASAARSIYSRIASAHFLGNGCVRPQVPFFPTTSFQKISISPSDGWSTPSLFEPIVPVGDLPSVTNLWFSSMTLALLLRLLIFRARIFSLPTIRFLSARRRSLPTPLNSFFRIFLIFLRLGSVKLFFASEVSRSKYDNNCRVLKSLTSTVLIASRHHLLGSWTFLDLAKIFDFKD